ncbi:MAG: type II toxin-antitoxin system RelE/ParE family toxin [Rhodospirillaceae bacterium]
MSGLSPSYQLTKLAESDFRNARHWSRQRWGRDLTRTYFKDLHEGALYVALNWRALPKKSSLTGSLELGIYAVREHYLVYVPIGEKSIVILALIRQSRDVPAILAANKFLIDREIKKLSKL